MYRNHEGYSDPTAGQALANIIREERAKRRALTKFHAKPVCKYSQPERKKRVEDPKEVSE